MELLNDIRAFLADKLNTYQSSNVAWENMPFDPATPSYLQFTFAQTTVDQVEYGTYGRDERRGFAQVTVYEPNGNGAGTALTKADAVAAVFPRGLSGVQNSTPVQVYRTVVGPAIQTNIHYAVPVTIEWRSVTQPIGV